MDILNLFKDIQKFILGCPLMNCGYPKISLYLWISIIHFWISINRFMAIQYSTDLWISKNDLYISQNDLWISKNDLWISKNDLWISKIYYI